MGQLIAGGMPPAALALALADVANYKALSWIPL